MVTDEQYRLLQDRVSELERKYKIMSQQLSSIMLKAAIPSKHTPAQPLPTKKDTTKYCLDGEFYCKRRLAYAIVKKYINDNPTSSINDVVAVFPDYIQGSLGVIRSADMAELYSDAHKRYYFADEDILMFDGRPYVVCSQWEKKNIERIISIAENLGYCINRINI